MTGDRRCYVVQDGANFYVYRRPGDAPEHVAWPLDVRGDFDLFGAQAARRWFVGTWCPANGVAPEFC